LLTEAERLFQIFVEHKVETMFGRSLVTLLVILVCLVGLIAPVLVDAHHWWPRKSTKKKPEVPGGG
jgi:hypothetical protein